MSRLSLKCASRTKSIGPSEFAASPPSLFERAQFVGWVERLVRRSSTSEGGSDVNQFRPGTVMGFATLSHPTKWLAGVILRLSTAISTVAALRQCSPFRRGPVVLRFANRLCPLLFSPQFAFPWRFWCPSRAKSTATEGLRICWSIRVGSVQKNGVHRCWHKPCIG